MTKSLKTHIIDSYSNLIKIEDFDLNHNQLILLTSIGTIYGKIFTFDESNVEKSVINQVNQTAEKQYFSDENKISGNDEYICLEDVVLITPTNNRMKFPYLNVFYDQIIAVTVGNYNQDDESK